MKRINAKTKKGEVLIMLVIIITVLTIIMTAAVALAFSSARDTTTFTLGERALRVAESGAENAILNLLRDPSYSGDVNLPIGTGNATIVVTGTAPYTITSTGFVGNMVRKIQVQVDTIANKLTVVDWQEI